MIKKKSKPSGLVISFLGPDGSGKSTVIDMLIRENLPFKGEEYFHLKPIKKTSIDHGVVTNPHASPPYSKLKSYLKLFYFIYQYNLGWFKNIKPLRNQSVLVIFDRYFDDMLVDTRRYRYGGSVKIADFARLLIPKPDLFFILTADAEVIFDRKQEVAFIELERQIKSYKELADGKRYYNIDVNRSPNVISEEIKQIILGKINENF